MPNRPNSPLIIWKLTDDKPGHENQSQGLINALNRKTPCQSYDIHVGHSGSALLALFTKRWQLAKQLPEPDLIIGTGHQTHLHLLATKRCYGGRTIVLMKPTLPVSLFDLAIIPEHDNYHGAGQVIVTKGALNTMSADGRHDKTKALILMGGPSKHYQWEETSLLAQIEQLIRLNNTTQFTLTTSRRTPSSFVERLKQVQYANLTVVPYEKTQAGWVAEQLAECGSAWISEDSVSMIYEALTAQVAVGLLNLPVKQTNRISRGVEKLIAQKLVTRFDKTVTASTLQHATGLNEADRCADWIMTNWLN